MLTNKGNLPHDDLLPPHPRWIEVDLYPIAAAQAPRFHVDTKVLVNEGVNLLIPLLKNGRLRDAYQAQDHKRYKGYLRSRCRWAGFHLLADDRRLHGLDPDELLNAIATDPQNPLDEAIQREHEEFLKAAIRSLPESARNLLGMKFHEERSHDVIGQRLGISAEAVTMRIHRIRLVLSHMLAIIKDDIIC